MCSVETKNSIYEKFKKGLTPIDIIGTLNIPNESKVVYGCYFYYKNRKNSNDFLQNEYNNSSRLAKNQRESIVNIAKFGRQLINSTKEITEADVHKKSDDYTFARQVLLHDIESEKCSNDVLDKIKVISKIRRNYKDMENIDAKLSKIKRELNNVVTAIENIIPYIEVDESNGTEIFIMNRTKTADEYRAELLSAIRG